MSNELLLQPALLPPPPHWLLLWWGLMALVTLGVITIVVLLIRNGWVWYRGGRYLNQLRTLAQQTSDRQFLMASSLLLKQVASQRYGRAQTAGLWGRDWLDFLDKTGGNGLFSACQIDANRWYQPGELSQRQRQQWLQAATRWLRYPR